ncbi:probable G-protein coupled receptor No18 [Ischnura elegans]|uniref:probable G-protein coupled receptor No18 n=1 Tax=Ischnura elegans TaxID=197161 RepID=UPI001ED8837A|nr:probable G-protein coupled receptor No18 [Ischnura elegans]
MLIAVTVVGNTLIILAVLTTKRLRTVTNCFVTSLAVADLLVGIFVMPPAVAYHLIGKWELGWVMCDIWVSLDVLLCTASILSLCAISVDRYLAVTQPLNYSRRRRSKRLALGMIFAVWLAAAAITCPPIFGWYEPDRHIGKTCGYNQDKGYVVFSAMGSFFIPLAVMLYVYARISCVIAQRHDHLASLNGNTRPHSSDGMLRPDPVRHPYFSIHVIERSNKGCQEESEQDRASSECEDPRQSIATTPTGQSCLMLHPPPATRAHYGARTPTSPSLSLPSPAINSSGTGRGSGPHQNHCSCYYSNSGRQSMSPSVEFHLSPAVSRQTSRMSFRRPDAVTADGGAGGGSSTAAASRVSSFRRESKTAQTLSVVVGGFVACWLPFFIIYLLAPFLPPKAISPNLVSILTWLGWINSAINPFIYAFYSPDFRNAFWRLTFKKCMKRPGSRPHHVDDMGPYAPSGSVGAVCATGGGSGRRSRLPSNAEHNITQPRTPRRL